MSYLEIVGGRVISLQSGHQPQFLVGLDANKPSSPGIGDSYYGTDSRILYACYAAGVWSVSNNPLCEEYANHSMGDDNFAKKYNTGNGSATLDAANHWIELSTGITLAGTGSFYANPSYVGYRAIFVNLMPADHWHGADGTRNGYMGLFDAIPLIGTTPVAAFHLKGDGTQECICGSGAAFNTTPVTLDPGGGEVLSILFTPTNVTFYKNNVIVAHYTDKIPTFNFLMIGATVNSGAGVTSAMIWRLNFMSLRLFS